MSRKPVPRKTQHDVLIKSRRRCALCYFLDDDFSEKDGQIAHIDKDNSNSAEDNLVFLCLNHHNKFDTKPSQTKGLQPEEVKTAKKALEEHIGRDFPSMLLESSTTNQIPTTDVKGVSVEVYDRRYPVYSAFWKFVLAILREVSVEEKERKEYVEGISDALFLYDDEMDEYLEEVHRQAMNLRRTQRNIGRSDQIEEAKWQEALKEEEELMGWFEKELMSGRRRFVKYLRLAC